MVKYFKSLRSDIFTISFVYFSVVTVDSSRTLHWSVTSIIDKLFFLLIILNYWLNCFHIKFVTRIHRIPCYRVGPARENHDSYP